MLAGLYGVERELGQGGMATVYLARDIKHNRQVAIKVLRPDLAEALGDERFLREIEIAANLNHPHILALLDSGSKDNFLYYVMPLVEGETLSGRVALDGAFPIPEVIRVFREMVDALAYAHGQGIVHRDIKPSNVMFTGRHVVVTDFGIAKAVRPLTGSSGLLSMAAHQKSLRFSARTVPPAPSSILWPPTSSRSCVRRRLTGLT